MCHVSCTERDVSPLGVKRSSGSNNDEVRVCLIIGQG